MHTSTTRRLSVLAAASVMAAGLAVPAMAQGSVNVVLNGNGLNLNPAPTERAGRVFVPLRGVFENMGASVVYASGTINAQGHGHSVQLHIGSQNAIVDGRSVSVDVAPFLIGASTYVPLRFVSQALGANVDWNNNTRTVAITTSGGGGAAPSQSYTAAPSNSGNSPVTIGNLLPRNGATIKGNRPTIQATFENGTVDPNTVHVYFDGRDVTSNAYISDKGVTYRPPTLPATSHDVKITGKDSAGASFDHSWKFTSGGGASVSVGFTNVSPPSGATVPNSFTISGHTSPGATVTVQVGVTQQSATNFGQILGAVLGVGGGNQGEQNTVTADGNGNFSSAINIGAPSGSTLGVVLTSTEPQYGVSSQPYRFTLRVR